MEVKYTHLATSPSWRSAYHVAVIDGRLHYKILRTGKVCEVKTYSSSVEEHFACASDVVVTPLNKFTGNS